MKELEKNISEVLNRLKNAQGLVFMLDFDGTLSPIVLTPEIAYLPEATKRILSELKKYFYVAIISGRELADIKEKVGLKDLIFAGNHGLEWQIEKEKKAVKIPFAIKKSMAGARKKFNNLLPKYSGLLLYDKRFSFTVHYRKLSQKQKRIFLKEAQKIIDSIKKTG